MKSTSQTMMAIEK